jgi:hypothetical protein
MSERHIPGFSGYLATDDGAIISTLGGAIRELSARIHRGYPHVKVTVRQNGQAVQRKLPVHRLVLLAFHGERPFEGAQCRHLDGDPTNNRPTNLAWGSARDNLEDAIRHGTAICLRRGVSHPRGRLSDNDVRIIRQSAGALPCAALARRFAVDAAYISRIQRGLERGGVQ